MEECSHTWLPYLLEGFLQTGYIQNISDEVWRPKVSTLKVTKVKCIKCGEEKEWPLSVKNGQVPSN